MNRNAQPAQPIHTLHVERWSPYNYDPAKNVAAEDLQAMFEAARWSASAFNAQPWRYIVGVKATQPEVWQAVLDVLVPGNQAWAQHVPVLALGLIRTDFEHNGKPNAWAQHDLGAASANLTVEATSRGIRVHQMAGIEPDKAIEQFGLAENIQPVTALAIGYAGPNDQLDPDIAARDENPRQRLEVSEFLVAGSV